MEIKLTRTSETEWLADFRSRTGILCRKIGRTVREVKPRRDVNWDVFIVGEMYRTVLAMPVGSAIEV